MLKFRRATSLRSALHRHSLWTCGDLNSRSTLLPDRLELSLFSQGCKKPRKWLSLKINLSNQQRAQTRTPQAVQVPRLRQKTCRLNCNAFIP